MADLRNSTRLVGYDYSGTGTYFVTICTAGRRHLFGKVEASLMSHSEWGEIASQEWSESVSRRPHIEPVAFVVMPNHVHGLVVIDQNDDLVNRSVEPGMARLTPKSLGALVNGYKGAVTRAIRTAASNPYIAVWQHNYHDRIVRNQREFDTVLNYIQENPTRWHEDRYNDP